MTFTNTLKISYDPQKFLLRAQKNTFMEKIGAFIRQNLTLNGAWMTFQVKKTGWYPPPPPIDDEIPIRLKWLHFVSKFQNKYHFSMDTPRFLRIYAKNSHINQDDLWKYLTIGWHFFDPIIQSRFYPRNMRNLDNKKRSNRVPLGNSCRQKNEEESSKMSSQKVSSNGQIIPHVVSMYVRVFT